MRGRRKRQRTGLVIIKTKTGRLFGAGEFDPVDLIIMLAAPDKHSHIEMISALAELFSSDEDMEKLHQANTRRTLKPLLTASDLIFNPIIHNITRQRDGACSTQNKGTTMKIMAICGSGPAAVLWSK